MLKKGPGAGLFFSTTTAITGSCWCAFLVWLWVSSGVTIISQSRSFSFSGEDTFKHFLVVDELHTVLEPSSLPSEGFWVSSDSFEFAEVWHNKHRVGVQSWVIKYSNAYCSYFNYIILSQKTALSICTLQYTRVLKGLSASPANKGLNSQI